ncbi:MAG: PIG-L family deacetylase [Verrucomicrobia bacterium]|nr:PIG-L family deacetylase [Verrucomicrobiota bacterium]
MKLNFKADRVLAVVAHPDDAELLCAGTLARAKRDGAAIAVCVMCSGDKGQPSRPVKNLAAVRRREMQAAAELLGAELFACGVPDGAAAEIPSQRRLLIEAFRRFKPSLVLAHAPEDYHPDHCAAAALAKAASWVCASRGYRTRSPVLPVPPALWFMDTVNMSGFVPGFYVDISPHVALKERMLACHKSQLARGKDSDFSPLLELMRVQMRARGMQSGVEAAEAFRICDTFKRTQAW